MKIELVHDSAAGTHHLRAPETGGVTSPVYSVPEALGKLVEFAKAQEAVTDGQAVVYTFDVEEVPAPTE